MPPRTHKQWSIDRVLEFLLDEGLIEECDISSGYRYRRVFTLDGREISRSYCVERVCRAMGYQSRGTGTVRALVDRTISEFGIYFSKMGGNPYVGIERHIDKISDLTGVDIRDVDDETYHRIRSNWTSTRSRHSEEETIELMRDYLKRVLSDNKADQRSARWRKCAKEPVLESEAPKLV
jgi:hypothetical protein